MHDFCVMSVAQTLFPSQSPCHREALPQKKTLLDNRSLLHESSQVLNPFISKAFTIPFEAQAAHSNTHIRSHHFPSSPISQPYSVHPHKTPLLPHPFFPIPALPSLAPPSYTLMPLLSKPRSCYMSPSNPSSPAKPAASTGHSLSGSPRALEGCSCWVDFRSY